MTTLKFSFAIIGILGFAFFLTTLEPKGPVGKKLAIKSVGDSSATIYQGVVEDTAVKNFGGAVFVMCRYTFIDGSRHHTGIIVPYSIARQICSGDTLYFYLTNERGGEPSLYESHIGTFFDINMFKPGHIQKLD